MSKQTKKNRAREHAAKTGMSYQAAYQQLFGNKGESATPKVLIKQYDQGFMFDGVRPMPPHYIQIDRLPDGVGAACLFTGKLPRVGIYLFKEMDIHDDDHWGPCSMSKAVAEDLYEMLGEFLKGTKRQERAYNGFFVFGDGGYEWSGPFETRKEAEKEAEYQEEMDGEPCEIDEAEGMRWELMELEPSPPDDADDEDGLYGRGCFLKNETWADLRLSVGHPMGTNDVQLSRAAVTDLRSGLGYFLGKNERPTGWSDKIPDPSPHGFVESRT